MTKICSKCNNPKSSDEFRNDKKSPDGKDYWCKKCRHDYYVSNAALICYRAIKRRQSNPERTRKIKRRWNRMAMKNPLYRLSNNIRGNMHHALKAKKAGRKWEDLVGYTLQDLINHIEPLLDKIMTWDNYGTEWHIDHITPKSWFKYTSTNDPQFKACWALNNLQPKLRLDNIRKGNRFKG